MADMSVGTVLRRVNLVPVGGRTSQPVAGATTGPVDILVGPDPDWTAPPTGAGIAGELTAPMTVLAVGRDLDVPWRTAEIDGSGTWAVPGLWDCHVHATSAALMTVRLDTSGHPDPQSCLRQVGHEVQLSDRAGHDPRALLVGFGHRLAAWDEQPSVPALDAVSGHHPIVLVAGDAHHGWLNTAAMKLLDVEWRDGVVAESEWFPVWERLTALEMTDHTVRQAWQRYTPTLHGRGIVGLVDYEMADHTLAWPALFAEGIDTLRIRAGVYTPQLASVLQLGLGTGDELPLAAGQQRPAGMATQGSYKIIADGSLSSLSACCFEPYAAPGSPHGAMEYSTEELHHMLHTAREGGLHAAVHAIGDRAVHEAVTAFAATGARGSIEHVQLARDVDQAAMARLGLTASMQPLHLLDDRPVMPQLWPGRDHDAFPMRTLLDHDVPLVLGSDAPVSPVDPWATMAAAVHRGRADASPWVRQQQITPAQALAASTDGWGTLAAGHRADVVLVDRDPHGDADTRRAVAEGDTAAFAQWMEALTTVVTMSNGRVVHQT